MKTSHLYFSFEKEIFSLSKRTYTSRRVLKKVSTIFKKSFLRLQKFKNRVLKKILKFSKNYFFDFKNLEIVF